MAAKINLIQVPNQRGRLAVPVKDKLLEKDLRITIHNGLWAEPLNFSSQNILIHGRPNTYIGLESKFKKFNNCVLDSDIEPSHRTSIDWKDCSFNNCELSRNFLRLFGSCWLKGTGNKISGQITEGEFRIVLFYLYEERKYWGYKFMYYKFFDKSLYGDWWKRTFLQSVQYDPTQELEESFQGADRRFFEGTGDHFTQDDKDYYIASVVGANL